MTQITLDPEKFGELVGGLVRKAISPLMERLDQVEHALKSLPEPISIADLLAADQLKTMVDLQVSESVGEFFEENPLQHGKDADPAEIAQMVKAAVDAIPPAKNGEDGVGVAGAIIDREGELTITTTKGQAIKLGRVVGEDGRDAIALENFSGAYDAERGFVLTATAGGQAKEFDIPIPRHLGYYREGMKCFAAASVTHDGSLWIAKRDTTAKPCREKSEDWILAARKGRDAVAVKHAPRERGPIKLRTD